MKAVQFDIFYLLFSEPMILHMICVWTYTSMNTSLRVDEHVSACGRTRLGTLYILESHQKRFFNNLKKKSNQLNTAITCMNLHRHAHVIIFSE